MQLHDFIFIALCFFCLIALSVFLVLIKVNGRADALIVSYKIIVFFMSVFSVFFLVAYCIFPIYEGREVSPYISISSVFFMAILFGLNSIFSRENTS